MLIESVFMVSNVNEPLFNAFLKLAMNQVLYCSSPEYLPRWNVCYPNLQETFEFQANFGLAYAFKEALFVFEQSKTITLNTLYAIEVIHQTVNPLIKSHEECNFIISEIQTKTFESWNRIKELFSCLPKPLRFDSSKLHTMHEILTNRWDANINSYSTKEICLFINTISDLMFYSSRHRGNQLGLLLFTNKIERSKPTRAPLESTVREYKEAIRSALHLQFAMAVLKPEALVKRFGELQRNSWLSHPLYSTDLPLPPHCRVPENFDDTEPEEIARITRLLFPAAAAEEKEVESANVLSTLNVESDPRVHPTGIITLELMTENRGLREPSDRTASNANSVLSLLLAEPVVVERLGTGEIESSELSIQSGPQRTFIPEIQRENVTTNTNTETNRGNLISLDAPTNNN